MRELHAAGVINNYDDYVALPFRVLEDARMWLAAEAVALRRPKGMTRDKRR